MELQLGLGLPIIHDDDHPMEGCELWRRCRFSSSDESKKHVRKKRSYEDYSIGECSSEKTTLPLLVWSGQPNEEEEDDDSNGNMHRRNIHLSNKNEGEENDLVGWPPIKSWRKKELNHQNPTTRVRQIRNNNTMQATNHHDENQNSREETESLYVKVNMEGVIVGRKIDLRLYNSYQTLTHTLVTMFAKYQNLEEDGASYKLTFQNEQGDWLLARHVPWQSFIATVRRLAILRNEK
ncbi:hypothetical protein PIB30_059862 [Stylosanthes scabra]|uniref:Auxin-induced protein n=1 Tax=Stylosanthes scabra TaxID=79078 RepID=A0ABU6QJV4_9FABA|nr:hypothetical protein [Stylosanthes scabra]